MPNCVKCKCSFPNRVIINGLARNLCSRKYCLECSPFGEHNTKKIHEHVGIKQTRNCPRCKKILPNENFYSRRGVPFSSVYCKKCTNALSVARQKKFKEQCVLYKGGQCEICGYKKCIAALEFHHTDPKLKELSIAKMNWNFNEKAKQELNKCQLLCANCHREAHSKIHPEGLEPST